MDNDSLAHKMELKISHRICAEVQTKGILSGKESSNREKIASIMRVERCKNTGSRSVSRSYPHACKHPTEV